MESSTLLVLVFAFTSVSAFGKVQDVESIEQLDSEFEGDIATKFDDMKQSTEFVVNEDKIKLEFLNDSEDTTSGLRMVLGIFCVVGGLLVLLLVGMKAWPKRK